MARRPTQRDRNTVGARFRALMLSIEHEQNQEDSKRCAEANLFDQSEINKAKDIIGRQVERLSVDGWGK